MIKRFQIFIFALSILTAHCQTSDLFEIFKKCQRRDSACLASQLQTGIENYAHNGLPQFNLNAFDPLRLPHLKSERNANSPFNIDFIVHDMDIIGLSKSKVVKVSHLDAALKTATLEVDIPKLLVKGGYEVKGNILIFPITGKGNSKILIENSRGKISVIFKDLPKSDPNYGQVDEVKLQLIPKRVQYRLDGLFNDNKDLSDAMHEVLNGNSLDIFQEVAPNIIKGVCIVLRDVLNEFFAKNKYDELLL